jgi:hypothetical protein
MNKLMAILLMTVAMSGQVMAARTGQEGGGGDASDARVNEIRSDLLNWINNGGAQELTLPKDISYGQYFDSMTDILQPKKVIVEFTNDKVLVKKVEKTCKGFIDRQSDQAHIQCNILRFKETSEAQQYRLIHHEYAGLVSIERNEGALSDYEISSQVTDYLEAKTVLRLAVKKSVKAPPVVFKDEAEKACSLKRDEIEKTLFEEFENKVARASKGLSVISEYYKKNELSKITNIELIDTKITSQLQSANSRQFKYNFTYKVDAGKDSTLMEYSITLFKNKLRVIYSESKDTRDKLGRITLREATCSLRVNEDYNQADVLKNNFIINLKNIDTDFDLISDTRNPYYTSKTELHFIVPR